MSTNGITCELVDERDLDTRYITGRLNPEEAEGFEAHFFACERCWALVQQGVEVRSALSPEPSAGHSQREASVFRRTRRGWWGVAAAAAVAAVMLGTWWTGQPSGLGPAEDVLRGGEVPFLVTSSGSEAALQATWPRLPDADLYRVRLYASDGSLVGAWEVADTAIALERESLPLPPGTAAFWQVQALDRLRNPIAGSELTRAVLPSSVP